MAFDINVIKRVYSEMSVKIDKARKLLGRPMTLSEKILYSHLWDGNNEKIFKRGSDYVDFGPDRVTCQDATAQMALLQFMQAGKSKVAVPTTVHCDHLIQAKSGAAQDLKSANSTSAEVFNLSFEIPQSTKLSHLMTYWYVPIVSPTFIASIATVAPSFS